MYLYLFQNGQYVEEIFVTNHNEFELEIYLRELKDKNGNVEIFRSEQQIEEPTCNGLANLAPN
jgi:hypothetical protein